MPWEEVSIMSQRAEFVRLVRSGTLSVRAACRRFGVSRPTGYKWLRRFEVQGPSGLADRSRRPRHSPGRVSAAMEEAILALREAYPRWGARKLYYVGRRQGLPMPAISTVHAVLARHKRIDPHAGRKHRPMQRFERDRPNSLWQMDFKGDFALGGGGRCYPLSVLDDHSRYAVGLSSCPDQRHGTVQRALIAVFRRHGLPEEILVDHGSPWGHAPETCATQLVVWLWRLDIRVCHGRPYHPQTRGKCERFHRTLAEEVLHGCSWEHMAEVQHYLDAFRHRYNLERPHQALADATPSTRYRDSERPYPERLPPLAYPTGAQLRKVCDARFTFQGRPWRIGKPFSGEHIGLCEGPADGLWQIYFGRHRVGCLDLKTQRVHFGLPRPDGVNHVSEQV